MFVFMKFFQCFIKINNGHIFGVDWIGCSLLKDIFFIFSLPCGLSLLSSSPDAELSEKCDQLLLVYIFGLTAD